MSVATARSRPPVHQFPAHVIVIPLGAAMLFLAFFNPAILDPSNIAWLMRGDWGQHFLGWQALRDEPWSWPLTHTTLYFPPAGAETALTDSNPLVSLLLRPFSSVLPDPFQFMGWWFVACIVLQVWFGFVLLRRHAHNDALAAMAGLVFAIWPTFVFRMGHDTLMAHFIILMALWVYLDAAPWRVRALRFAGVLALAATIHPHVFLMAAALWSGDRLRGVLMLSRPGRLAGEWGRFAAASFGPFFAGAFSFWVVGVIPGTSGRARGWGEFSMNLTAPFNPAVEGYSALLPALPVGPGQYEGFQYFGVGLLALLALGVVLSCFTAKRPEAPRVESVSLVWLAPVCVGLTLLALSTTIRWSDVTLFHLALDDRFADRQLGIIRASGRFFWPVGYVVLFLALRTVLRRRQGVALAALAGVFALQAFDLGGFAEAQRARTAAAEQRNLQRAVSPLWPHLMATADRVDFIPARPPHNKLVFYEVLWHALTQRTPINTMYMSRIRVAQERVSNDSQRAFDAGERDPTRLYILQQPCNAPGVRPDDVVVRLDGIALIAPASAADIVADLPRGTGCGPALRR